jgi:hypothetical protein
VDGSAGEDVTGVAVDCGAIADWGPVLGGGLAIGAVTAVDCDG